MGTLVEGIDASAQPCTLAVVLPAVAVVLTAGRHALVSWVGFVLGCLLIFWARAAGHWELSRSGVMQWVVAALAVAALSPASIALKQWRCRRAVLQNWI